MRFESSGWSSGDCKLDDEENKEDRRRGLYW